ncbi:MAG: 3-deoxy-D-manno-octulosonic acid transferase [Bacteroidota bacterium]
MRWIYTIGIYLYSFVIALVSLFNEKAGLLRKGRRQSWRWLKENSRDSGVVWIHCASLGEFEQGRPLIEHIKEQHPEKKILLTFYSPSGYEIRKNYELADQVLYLPADTPRNARRFVEMINPDVAIFVKYEFWPHFFSALKKSQVPLYSVSAIFRKNQLFFKWYGTWFSKNLRGVTKFYVQDQTSGQLLESLGFKNYVVVGDTRFDRVKEIVNKAVNVPVAKEFSESASFVLVAGSTWPPDEDILIRYINQAPADVKMIMAPHEVHEPHIQQMESRLDVPSFRYSQADRVDLSLYRVMIVDTIGLLSAIYRYGHMAYIGGGFGKGIHNTLEAATYRIPVIFGPRYQKFKEACDLIEVGGGFSVGSFDDCYNLIEEFRKNTDTLKIAGNNAGSYVDSMCGATSTIIKEIFP